MMLWFDSHRRARARLSLYLDGELAERDAALLEAHLGACESCAQELAELRLTVAAVSELRHIEAPRSFALTSAQVARPAVRATPAAARSVNSGLRLTGGALAAALAVLLVLDAGGLAGGGGEVSTQDRGAASLEAGADAGSDNPLKSLGGEAAPETEDSSAQGYLATETPAETAGADNDLAMTETPGGAAGSGGSGGVGGGPATGGDVPSATPLYGAGAYVPPTDAPTATAQPPAEAGDDGEASQTPLPEAEPRQSGVGAATDTPLPGGDGLAVVPAVPNGTEERALGTLPTADSNVDSDDGPSTLLVAEIVLAVLLGVSLIGIAAATYAERRRG